MLILYELGIVINKDYEYIKQFKHYKYLVSFFRRSGKSNYVFKMINSMILIQPNVKIDKIVFDEFNGEN